MPKPPWQIASNLAIATAAFAVVLASAALIRGAFGGSLETLSFDKGAIPVDIPPGNDTEVYKEGIHVATGLAAGRGLAEVRANCTNCHSAKLITQNRMTRDGWRQTIIWMQQTQGLWDLGEYQGLILDYLAEHYAPEDEGRRSQLTLSEDDWYKLELK